MSIGRTVILPALVIAMAAPSARASHAHLNYPDWWKPVKEIALTAPAIEDADARRQAFAERQPILPDWLNY